jgi:hypothetical protein
VVETQEGKSEQKRLGEGSGDVEDVAVVKCNAFLKLGRLENSAWLVRAHVTQAAALSAPVKNEVI